MGSHRSEHSKAEPWLWILVQSSPRGTGRGCHSRARSHGRADAKRLNVVHRHLGPQQRAYRCRHSSTGNVHEHLRHRRLELLNVQAALGPCSKHLQVLILGTNGVGDALVEEVRNKHARAYLHVPVGDLLWQRSIQGVLMFVVKQSAGLRDPKGARGTEVQKEVRRGDSKVESIVLDGVRLHRAVPLHELSALGKPTTKKVTTSCR